MLKCSFKYCNLLFTNEKQEIQRNHIACAMFIWLRLKHLAYQTGQTVYQIKHNLLFNYLIQQLKRPDVHICLV